MIHRQIIDSFRKGSDLPHSPLRVLHLQQVHQVRTCSEELRRPGRRERCVLPDLLHLVQVLLVDPDPSFLEAAALGHFYVHGADVLLAFILTFLPQSAETSK